MIYSILVIHVHIWNIINMCHNVRKGNDMHVNWDHGALVQCSTFLRLLNFNCLLWRFCIWKGRDNVPFIYPLETCFSDGDQTE
jgi:hypothetical protein